MQFSVLHKGYFWEAVGLVLFLVPPLVMSLIYDCGGYGLECALNPGAFVVLPVFSFLIGIGLYLVGAAHISISSASIVLKLLAVWLPLLIIGGLIYLAVQSLPTF